MTEIRCNRLVLETETGKEAIILSTDANGEPSFELKAKSGASVFISVSSDSYPRLSLLDAAGRSLLNVGIAPDLGTGLSISDASGYPLLFLRVSKDGEATMSFFKREDTGGKCIWKAP